MFVRKKVVKAHNVTRAWVTKKNASFVVAYDTKGQKVDSDVSLHGKDQVLVSFVLPFSGTIAVM